MRTVRAVLDAAPRRFSLRARRGSVPVAVLLVVIAVTSLQFGAGYAATLFDRLGPAGGAFVPLGCAAIVLLVMWRPRVRSRAREEIGLAVAFGLTLGAMNVLI